MSALDTAAEKLRSKSAELAAQGGVKAKVGELLAEDAEFLPKLKPALIKKRMKGDAPTDQAPSHAEPPAAPSGPQLGKRPKAKRSPGGGGGAMPFIVVGAVRSLGVTALSKGTPPVPEQAIEEAKLTTEALKSGG